MMVVVIFTESKNSVKKCSLLPQRLDKELTLVTLLDHVGPTRVTRPDEASYNAAVKDHVICY